MIPLRNGKPGRLLRIRYGFLILPLFPVTSLFNSAFILLPFRVSPSNAFTPCFVLYSFGLKH
jgi:hypothetical protein